MNRKQRKQKLKQRRAHGKPIKPFKLGQIVTVKSQMLTGSIGSISKAVVLAKVGHSYILGNMEWSGHDSGYTLANAPETKLLPGADKFLDGHHTWLFARSEMKV